MPIISAKMRDNLLDCLKSVKFKAKAFESLAKILTSKENVTGKYPTRPGSLAVDSIRSVSETAFQRAIFNGRLSTLDFVDGTSRTVDWLDLELPVVLSNKSRRRCIDLIGRDAHAPFLCELKFSKGSGGDRPEYGIFELAVYYFLVRHNRMKLDDHNVHHLFQDNPDAHSFQWKDVVQDRPLLIFAANRTYWRYWFERQTYRPRDTKEAILNLVDDVNRAIGVNICLFETPDEDFESQKKDSLRYSPRITSRRWKQIGWPAGGLKLTVHRGTHQIGGSCVELTTKSSRVFIDLGEPLPPMNGKKPAKKDVLPKIKGLYRGGRHDESIVGVLISHSHPDHFGLTDYVNRNITLYASSPTQTIIDLSSVFLRDVKPLKNVQDLRHRRTFKTGDFAITPYWVDHSAFDSHMFLIEGAGKRVLYSGDFRKHGRKSKSLYSVIRDVRKRVDVLLLEGTTIGRKDAETKSELDLMDEMKKVVLGNPAITLVAVSGQNVDRLVTLFKVAQSTRRYMVVDPYIATVLTKLREYAKLPYPSKSYWPIKVYYPKYTSNRLRKEGHENYLYRFKDYKITKAEISEKHDRIMMCVRSSVIDDLKKIDNLRGGNFIYSMWEGYKKTADMKKLLDFAKSQKMKIVDIHTSGHADTETLKKFIERVEPKLVVPIHTDNPEAFKEICDNVRVLKDGEMLEV